MESAKSDRHPHAFCSVLLSPEHPDTSGLGQDTTDILQDNDLINDWVRKAQLQARDDRIMTVTVKKVKRHNMFQSHRFHCLAYHAFSSVFSGIRETPYPEREELVVWYYTGHGLGKENAAKLCKPHNYSSTPCLDKLVELYELYPNCDVANDFVKEGRKVKGGELCLHDIGFCDLYGLLKPWIAAVMSESINGIKKKNKHLVVILDSCHSGIIAQELNDFKSQTEEKDPTLLDKNSVTIQAACGPDERTFGGYFTPCFVYLNEPKNEKLLSDLKVEWKEMSEERQNEYSLMDLPSPMVVTTRDQSEGPTMELTVQNFKLTLFPDPGFFKFCTFKVFHDQHEKSMMSLKDRMFNSTSVTEFLKSSSFNVLDYKLRPYKGLGPTDPNAGTPMGLFLLDDLSDPNHPTADVFAVCAHIHFPKGNTDIASVQRINLVHMKKPPTGSALYAVVVPGDRGIPVTNLEEAKGLIEACFKFVEKNDPGKWNKVSQWNMKGSQTGVNGKFRQQERSAWEDSYLEYIKQFNLPTVAKTDEQPS